MTKGSPAKLIMKFVIPLIIGNIFQQFYSMCDTIIVGRYVGVQALAAVGATGTIMFLIIGFMQGLTTGFTIITSQRFGASDTRGMKKSVGNAVTLSIIVTVIGTIVSVVCMRPLLSAMNTPGDIYEQAYTYIIIICYGMGSNILYNLLASVLRAVGNSKVPLYFLVIAAVTNVVLDLVFIINFHMGVAGAAWATVISQAFSGVLCLIYIVKKVPLLHVTREDLFLDYYCAKAQLTTGVPMALQFSITAVGTIMVQSALNMLGSVAIAAYTTAVKVDQLVTQPFLALGMTMATYCGQNRGISDFARIRKGVNTAMLMTVVYAVVIGIVVVFSIPYIIPFFIKGDVTQITAYAQTYMNICAVFFIPLGSIFIYRNALQGSGLSFLPMLGGVVELVSRAGVAMIAAYSLSYAGVCAANPAAWVSAALFLWIAYFVAMRRFEKRQA